MIKLTKDTQILFSSWQLVRLKFFNSLLQSSSIFTHQNVCNKLLFSFVIRQTSIAPYINDFLLLLKNYWSVLISPIFMFPFFRLFPHLHFTNHYLSLLGGHHSNVWINVAIAILIQPFYYYSLFAYIVMLNAVCSKYEYWACLAIYCSLASSRKVLTSAWCLPRNSLVCNYPRLTRGENLPAYLTVMLPWNKPFVYNSWTKSYVFLSY